MSEYTYIANGSNRIVYIILLKSSFFMDSWKTTKRNTWQTIEWIKNTSFTTSRTPARTTLWTRAKWLVASRFLQENTSSFLRPLRLKKKVTLSWECFQRKLIQEGELSIICLINLCEECHSLCMNVFRLHQNISLNYLCVKKKKMAMPSSQFHCLQNKHNKFTCSGGIVGPHESLLYKLYKRNVFWKMF